MTRREPPEDPPTTYMVGYGKPPVATRFQKGKSGNPNGRPAKASVAKSLDGSLIDAVLDLSRQLVTVREGDDHRQISGRAVVLKSIMKSAASGNSRSQRHMMELIAEAEAAEAAQIDEEHRVWARYVQMKKAEIADCKRRGVTPPRMVPHPDDIYILDGKPVVFVGPRTEREADELDKLARLNEALLVHQGWELDELPDSADGVTPPTLAECLFNHINPSLPARMRFSDEKATERMLFMGMFSRRRQKQMALEAWAKAFPDYTINLKKLPNIIEIMRSAGIDSPLSDAWAKRFDVSTTS